MKMTNEQKKWYEKELKEGRKRAINAIKNSIWDYERRIKEGAYDESNVAVAGGTGKTN